MQKIINALALVSFGVSASIVGAGVYVFANQDALKELVLKEAKEQLGTMMGGQLGRALLSGPEGLPAPTPEVPSLPLGL